MVVLHEAEESLPYWLYCIIETESKDHKKTFKRGDLALVTM